MERTWSAPYGQIDHDALEQAKVDFAHYWHPKNIEAIALYVEDWQRGHTWEGLNAKGPQGA